MPTNESILSESSTDRHTDTFTPVFIDEQLSSVSLPNNTDELCGDNIQCKYDYALTQKESIAKSTAQFTEKFQEMKKDLDQIGM